MRAYIPETLEAAIDKLAADLTPASRAFILDPTSSSSSMHFFTGMGLRNEWGLWANSVLAIHFKTRFGLGHADDMSGMILKGLWCTVRGQPYDPEKDAAFYRDFWRRQGLDPLTQDLTSASAPSPSLWARVRS